MNSNVSKYGFISGFILIIVALLIVIKFQHDSIQKQTSLEQTVIQMKQFQDGTVRDQVNFVTKDDLQKIADQEGINLKQIEEDIKHLHADLEGIGSFQSNSQSYHGSGLSSSGQTTRTDPVKTTTPCVNGVCPNLDQYGYLNNAQIFQINEHFDNNILIPFGQTTFKAWQKEPWSLDINARQYKVDTIVAEDDAGKKIIYNKFTIATNGKTYDVKIDQASFSETLPEAKFRFSPRLGMGLDVGMVFNTPIAPEVTPKLQVNLFSYGKSVLAPDFNILGLGLGYETQAKQLGISVSPVSYNFGQHIPLIKALYVGPSVSFDTGAKFEVALGIQSLL